MGKPFSKLFLRQKEKLFRKSLKLFPISVLDRSERLPIFLVESGDLFPLNLLCMFLPLEALREDHAQISKAE
jgi:hypothetical protein